MPAALIQSSLLPVTAFGALGDFAGAAIGFGVGFGTAGAIMAGAVSAGAGMVTASFSICLGGSILGLMFIVAALATFGTEYASNTAIRAMRYFIINAAGGSRKHPLIFLF
jgi:hypothetical protein